MISISEAISSEYQLELVGGSRNLDYTQSTTMFYTTPIRINARGPMTVIDVDSHFEVPFGTEDNPLLKWAERMPSTAEYTASILTGDLARVSPALSVPSDEDVTNLMSAENVAINDQVVNPDARPLPIPVSASERVAWLDQIGIDYALVNPGAYAHLVDHLGVGRAEPLSRLNDFIADRLEAHIRRLMPVSLIDWSDLGKAVVELERMRSRGSRAFWIRAEAFNGISPAHPDWDRVWSAATDLGMIAILHVGNTPARFEGGWGNASWELPGGTGLGGFFRYANSLRHQAAEMMVGAMVYGGVFGRHPNLTILTEELMVGWLPYFMARCEGLDRAGPWPFDLKPSEMVRRNVRATPLPGLGDRNILDVILPQLPEMVVFSSDYPHNEGNANPIELYEPALSGLSPKLRASFLGENMADCFARMGDPLTMLA
jgi:predicted TIM-barrel fold metal-dependent hydrolase